MIDPPSVRVAVPRSAPDPPRDAVPWLPIVVPMIVAIVLTVVTGSPVLLVAALAGPLLGLATRAAARRTRRRRDRAEGERLARAESRAVAAATRVAVRERARRESVAALEPRWGPGGEAVIAVARERVPSGVAFDADEDELPAPLAAAAVLDDAPVLAGVADAFWIAGEGSAAAAVARVLVLRLVALVSPEVGAVTAPASETWVAELPHPSRSGAADEYRVDLGDRVVGVAWGGPPMPGAHRVAPGAADAATRPAAARAARELAQRVRPVAEARAEPRGDDAEDATRSGPVGLAAVLGGDEAGEVVVDLVLEGPHAVVGGTTGSGKSEALATWVAGLARGRTPRDVAVVLVDFKGGAAFDRLAVLPHVAAVVTDLDPRGAARALDALAGEVERRERVLAARRVADIDHLPAGELPRLVVVVDEYAALVARHPEAPGIVADLAARGRSLGIHLILGTQRPATSIGDAVLANVALRLVLRVADARDSSALLGTDAAARIPAAARGRALLGGGSAGTRAVQIARSGDDEIAAIAAASPGERALPPWSPPLPDVVPRSTLPRVDDGLAFGLRDEPRARQPGVAAWEPRHGHLLVVGGPGAGASAALATLAAAAGESARWLPSDPVELWGVLAGGDALASPGVLLADDLDAALAAADADHAVEFVDLVARLLRGAPRRGVRVAASVRGLGGPLRGLTGLFGARLLLRLPTREDHVLAGGSGARFDPRARPGAAEWEDAIVQVATPEPGPRRLLAGAPPVALGPPEVEIAVVSTRPATLATRWGVARCRAVAEGSAPDSERPAILGDPDAWLADWNALARARRELPILFHECGVAEVRALTRGRLLPPLLATGESWLLVDGALRRAVVE